MEDNNANSINCAFIHARIYYFSYPVKKATNFTVMYNAMCFLKNFFFVQFEDAHVLWLNLEHNFCWTIKSSVFW